MELRKIKKLIKLLQESQITEIEVRHGDETIRVCQASDKATKQADSVSVPRGKAGGNHEVEGHPPATDDTHTRLVKSPMVGVFYAASEPGAEPFVQPGQRVQCGDVLCIIEAMKIMNPLEAEEEGVVREIMIDDGAPVEYGQTLFILDKP